MKTANLHCKETPKKKHYTEKNNSFFDYLSKMMVKSETHHNNTSRLPSRGTNGDFLILGEGETNESFRHNNVFRSPSFFRWTPWGQNGRSSTWNPRPTSTSQLQKLLPSSIENGTGVVDRKASRLFIFCPGQPERANENSCECQAAYDCNLSELNHEYVWFTLTCFCDFKEDHSSNSQLMLFKPWITSPMQAGHPSFWGPS